MNGDWQMNLKRSDMQHFGGKDWKSFLSCIYSPSLLQCLIPSLRFLSSPCSSAPQPKHDHSSPLSPLLSSPLLSSPLLSSPLLSSPLLSFRPSLAVVIDHVEQGLQQAVVPVPVRLGAVEAVAVVAVDAVLGAAVLVDEVQSLVQLLRGESCSWR